MTLSKKSVTSVSFDDAALTRQFAAVVQQLSDVSAAEILDGRLVQATIPASGVLMLAHGLNRRWQGAIVVACSAAYSPPVGSPQASTADVYATLTFATGAGATVRLWVF